MDKQPTQAVSAQAPQGSQWAGWESYAFTAVILVGIGALFVGIGYADQHAVFWQGLLGLMALSTIVSAGHRGVGQPGAILAHVLNCGTIGAACFYFTVKHEPWLANGCAVLAGMWICLAIITLSKQRQQVQERTEHIDEALNRLRRAVGEAVGDE
ncbi:MAG TPA: hypothetical protein DCY79_20130 [Planctomycetaceae bacterium]|nr:hypothetical protein [Blastopirellula sp.]HAY82119.1 hypothetical protein [Planctomycetaceae bacterium]